MLEKKDLEQLADMIKNSSEKNFESYKQTFAEGQEHSKMSPETSEHISLIKDSINEIKITIAQLPEVFMGKCENKFASKVTEKIVYTMIGIICVGVLTALLSTVVKAFN